MDGMTGSTAPIIACPATDRPGSPVHSASIDVLSLSAHGPHGPRSRWYFCPEASCLVAFYDDRGGTIGTDAIRTRVGSKPSSAPEPICYCFGVMKETIQDEARREGHSATARWIRERVRARECTCEALNPRRVCCLGEVQKAVKEARGSDTPEGRNGGAWTLSASVLAGLTASLCCIVPVVVTLLGLGAAGFGAVFEPYRPVLAGVAVLMLVASFHLIYVRPLGSAAACRGGESCAPAAQRSILRLLFWAGASLVAAALALPYYMEYLI